MELLHKIRNQIRRIKNSGKLVVVEGKKDKVALEKLGLNKIKTLSKKPLFEIIEEIAEKYKDCILLVDLDKEGKKIYGKLNSGLQNHGVRIDNSFREFLFKETKLRQIEGLPNYLRAFI